eukprot:CAMPEP_0113823072 /NCGR_PEP_ID=MMETSP0328-20130328/2559_1 /TAXON_ID=39455 /ORGANISM="Alexandrium minutum" /LENGTH=169 /DNA_ID=CAMNT_0000791011 /DNA_START=57 /DNA_END=566 /DNA_ORIENTATION=+ /assembly_acc=CAM_ASM_000350
MATRGANGNREGSEGRPRGSSASRERHHLVLLLGKALVLALSDARAPLHVVRAFALRPAGALVDALRQAGLLVPGNGEGLLHAGSCRRDCAQERQRGPPLEGRGHREGLPRALCGQGQQARGAEGAEQRDEKRRAASPPLLHVRTAPLCGGCEEPWTGATAHITWAETA